MRISDWSSDVCSSDLRESLTMAQAMLSAPKHADMLDDKPHHLTAVVGVRGGVGASLVSTSLAWTISEQAGRQTGLLDLDVHFGTGALPLDLEPGRGLIAAIGTPKTGRASGEERVCRDR